LKWIKVDWKSGKWEFTFFNCESPALVVDVKKGLNPLSFKISASFRLIFDSPSETECIQIGLLLHFGRNPSLSFNLKNPFCCLHK